MRKLFVGFFFILLLIGVIDSCVHKRYTKHKKIHVKEYKVYSSTGEKGDDYIWYYIILTDNDSYYYYSSPTKITQFNNVTWLPSKVNPLEEEDMEEVEEENDISIDDGEANISSIMETEISEEETSEEDGDNSSESSDDGSSGDSGGDSGGSDGGGDGGGD